MVALSVHELSFSHASVLLFDHVSFHLGPGIHGLVGANGAGKTTLLALLAGALAPDEGEIRFSPRDARITSCEQPVEHLSAGVRAFALSTSAEASASRGRLGLEEAPIERWSTLSPGERKRWQIGAALLDEPDVLLLDEPTNHLDRETRDRLVAELRRFRGLAIIVSHDRALLDELPRSIARLHAGGVIVHPGGYEEAREDWTRQEAAQAEEHATRVAEHRALIARLDDARRTQAAADAARSTRHRSKGPRDHDASNSLRKGLADFAEARAGRRVAVLRAEAERAGERAAEGRPQEEPGREVWLDWRPSPRPRLLALDAAELRAGDRVILRGVQLALGRSDRVHLAGRSGAGKTTLLRALLRAAPAGVMYVPQELTEAEAQAIVRGVRAEPREVRGRVLSLAAALGASPDRLLATGSPSPGEAKKLQIALGLGRRAFGLVLDEPTNHLDLPSIERLEAALAGYPGALLLVSHDEAFAAACTRSTWRVEDGLVHLG
jgi:ATPase subunit of ABC transporter with duplicated ATPase domains